MKKVCFWADVDGLPIELTQQGPDNFTVTYWKQVKKRLTYEQAARELGRCLMHAAACAGNLDNRTRAEARKDK